MRTRYRAIARVEKTHGRRGEVVTSSVHGLPAYVREGMTLAVVPPALKGPRMLRVVEAGEADDTYTAQEWKINGQKAVIAVRVAK